MRFLVILFLTFTVACGSKTQPDATPDDKKVVETAHKKEMPKEEPSSMSASAPTPAAVTARIDDAKTRLGESEGGKIVWDAIEQAGGLEKWFKAPLAFRFNYAPLKRDATDTFQVIDTFSSKARHAIVKDDKWAFDEAHHQFGWDGEKAWTKAAKGTEFKGPRSARFWALTPYYFVGIPFVLADPGVVLNKEKDATLDGVDCHVVHVSFSSGTGDAPDDYYIVYFDKQTKRVKGLRYVVSYKGFFPDGGHSPEKVMVYEGTQVADGLTFATAHPTYKWDGSKGELVTNITVTDVAQSPESTATFFEVPDDANVIDGY